MKRYVISLALLLGLAFGLATLFTSCEREGDSPNKPSEACKNEGILERVTCGASVLDDFWIRLSDGTYLQPCETTVSGFQGVEGAKVKFGYKVLDNRKGCEGIITCMAMTPPAKVVRITCIQMAEQTNCNLNGLVLKNVKGQNGCQVTVIEMPGGGRVEPVDQQAMLGYMHNTPVMFSYTQVQTFARTCSGAPAAQITCIKTLPFCGTIPCTPLTVTKDIATSNSVRVISAWIDGDCLHAKIGFSGCDASTDRFRLLWSGSVMESNPVQVNLVLNDPAETVCNAYFEGEVSYDLRSLKQSTNQAVTIHLGGYEQTLLYQ